jgi:hypothetical protein
MGKKWRILFLFLVAVMAVVPLGTGLVAATSAYSVDWVRQFGSANQDDIWAAGTDGLGYAYAAGDALASINGADHPGDNGNRDVFVIKYNSTGSVEWTRGFGTTSSDIAYGVTGDGLGNCYVVGETQGALYDGGQIFDTDAFIRQYSSDGTAVWTYQFGTTNDDNCKGVAADAAGNVYVVGDVVGDMDGQENAGASGSDGFIRKYDVYGVKQWTRLFGTAHSEYDCRVVLDSSGNAYVVGRTGGTFSGETKIGTNDAFVRKFDSDGNTLWTHQWGIASEYLYPTGIGVDSSGCAFVSGYTLGTFTDETNLGVNDAFVSKLNSAGTAVLWNREFGTAGQDRGNGITVDTLGNAFVAGYVTGALPGQTFGGNQDAFVREYDSTGIEQWTYQYTTTRSSPAVDGTDNANGIASDTSGNVFIAGTIFGHFPGYADHSYDGYVLKMIPPSAPSGQTWYLDSTVGAGAYPVMEQTVGTQSGVVPVAGTTVLWLSDQPAGSGGVAFNDGTWKVHLENTFTGNYWVQIGQSNGTYGDFTAFHYGANAPTTGVIDLDFDLTGISVPAGCYLALLVNNTGTGNVITDGTSYLASPDSTPSYPVPEIAAGILLAGGLAGLAALIVIRRRKAKAAA